MPDSNLADGDVLTSSFYNTYVREQVVVTCTSATRPSGVEGRLIYETDTNKLMIYNGSWTVVASAGWTNYTPAWTNLTPGNATVAARYIYVPGGLRMSGVIIFGSTTSISGSVSQTVPNSETAAGWSAGAFILDDGPGAEHSGSCRIGAGGTAVEFYGPTGNWNATNPFAYATGDRFSWDITVPL